jgi:outer membrane protein
MKKAALSLLFALSLSLFTTQTHAQQKVGYINMEDLISAMPETRQAQQTLQACSDSLQKVDNAMQVDFATKRDAFFQDSASMDNVKKEAARKVLQKLIQQYQEFRSGAQEQLDSTKQALWTAIETKAENAVATVAKANGFTHVIRKQLVGNNQSQTLVLVGPASGDLLPLVKKQLGL